MKKIAFRFLFLTALTILLVTTSCRAPDYIREERIAKAEKYYQQILERKIPEGKTFSLDECISIALLHNLDLKVFRLKEEIDKEKKSAAMLGMLPDLIGTYSYKGRTNEPGATSVSVKSGDETLEASRSSERHTGTLKVEAVFSILDFGLAFFTAQQEEDRGTINTQQRKRAAQNLVFDVARAYYRVAATQYAMANTEKLLKLSRVVESNLGQIAKSRSLSPMRILAEKKQILRLKQRIEEYRRVYENSCIELNTLMGYTPWQTVSVDTAVLEKYDKKQHPKIEELEELALHWRPELLQLDAQTRISVLEARKAILMMFPNVQAVTDFNHSTNKYLYNKMWWEIGFKAAYNLLKLPQKIQKYKALDKQIDTNEAKTLALTAGIIAQVRIAHANLDEVERRYRLSEAIYRTHLQQLRAAKEEMKAGGRISQLEVFKMAMETASASIERTQQLGNCYLAYYRLINSAGVNSFVDAEEKTSETETGTPEPALKKPAEEAEVESAEETKEPEAETAPEAPAEKAAPKEAE